MVNPYKKACNHNHILGICELHIAIFDRVHSIYKNSYGMLKRNGKSHIHGQPRGNTTLKQCQFNVDSTSDVESTLH